MHLSMLSRWGGGRLGIGGGFDVTSLPVVGTFDQFVEFRGSGLLILTVRRVGSTDAILNDRERPKNCTAILELPRSH